MVLRLLEPVSGVGHHVYMDNHYTSPGLFAELHRHGFEACGTLHLDRRGVPPEAKAALRKGSRRAITVDDDMAIVSGTINVQFPYYLHCTVTNLSRLNADPLMYLVVVSKWRNLKLLWNTQSTWVGWTVEISFFLTMGSHIGL